MEDRTVTIVIEQPGPASAGLRSPLLHERILQAVWRCGGVDALSPTHPYTHTPTQFQDAIGMEQCSGDWPALM